MLLFLLPYDFHSNILILHTILSQTPAPPTTSTQPASTATIIPSKSAVE
jgi:hypothetical protein